MAIANEKELLSMMMTAFPPVRKVLVIAPHPDDEVFGCGGTLSLLRDGGSVVTILIVTNGALGGESADGKLIEIRAEESCAAARILGLDAPVFWGWPDRGVNYGEVLIGRLVETILETDADLVFLPSPADWHPDHQAIAFAGAEAIRRLGGKRQAAFYEVTDPLPCPNLIHDISSVEEQKNQAVRCFHSQLQEQPFDTRISGINHFRALHLGAQVKSAEAFTLLTAADLDKGLVILLDGPLAYRRNLGFAASGGDIPLVSVIIRSMDRPTLTDTLDSLALQTYSNIEVVLVNAKGAGHQQIEQWCWRIPVRMMGTGERLPRSRAANMGMDAAHGEYLMFLDDDDWIEADHIQQLVDAIRQHPEFRVVYTGAKCVDENKKPLANKFDRPFDATQMVAGNFIPIHAALFSQKLLNLGCRLDEALNLYEDWDFWIQLSRHGDFLHIDGLSAVYRIAQQAGFGVNADPVVAERAALTLYRKWFGRLEDRQITVLMDAVRNNPVKDSRIATLQQELGERDGKVAGLEQQIIGFEQQIIGLEQQITGLEQQITGLEQQITGLEQAVLERDGLTAVISEMRESTSWRITAPMRWLAPKIKHAIRLLRLMPNIVRFGGGPLRSLYKALRVFSREGWQGVKQRVLFVDGTRSGALSTTIRLDPLSGAIDRNDYAEWIRRYDALTDNTRREMRTKIEAFHHKPLISVVMPTYNPPVDLLEQAIQSVCAQLYTNLELCIADDASSNPEVKALLQKYASQDARIKFVLRETNGHISAASNSALKLAAGEFIALLDHDDLLAEHALFWVVDAINGHPAAGLIYSDEDKINLDGTRHSPYFKCDWNYDLFLSHNMISHLGVYRAELVNQVGGFRVGYEGSQDHDLALRCIEKLSAAQIIHIPRVLYHWRVLPGGTAYRGDEKPYAAIAGAKAINDHLRRCNIAGQAMHEAGHYRVQYDIPSPEPLVSLIIPTRNGLHLLRQCVESILSKTSYTRYEILIVDNGSDDAATLDYLQALRQNPRVRVLRDDRPFNYSAINNAAVTQAQGSIIGLINNDIEVISPGWLNEMVSHAVRPEIGCVGARLWFPDGTLQHGGVILGLGGVAGHGHYRLQQGNPGYFGRAQVIQNFSAVTAACLLVRKNIYMQVGGLDEENLAIAFNDVDFCLRVGKLGYRNLWTPYAELYHHESATRGADDTPEKMALFQKEIKYMQTRWGAVLLTDAAYSPNLACDQWDFSLAWPPRRWI